MSFKLYEKATGKVIGYYANYIDICKDANKYVDEKGIEIVIEALY